MLTFKGVIIANSSKKIKYPYFRDEIIRSYRRKNNAIRHEYYSLCDKYSALSKCMLTFTVGGRGRGVYTKLRLINEVKKYIVHLINTTKADIYYFATIELGHSLNNPHLHLQVFGDDKKIVQVIYDKVIDRFNLNSKRCTHSVPNSDAPQHYNYVIKDFSKDLTDDEVWHIEQTKKRMRKTLGLKLRFYARSKSKYNQKTYRFFYRNFNVIRAKADEYIEWFYSLFFRKQRVFITSTILLIVYRINMDGVCLLKSYFLVLCADMDVLFYSPSLDPPCFVVLVLVCRLMTIGLLCSVALY